MGSFLRESQYHLDYIASVLVTLWLRAVRSITRVLCIYIYIDVYCVFQSFGVLLAICQIHCWSLILMKLIHV